MEKKDWLNYLLACCYFISTTVNIIGYGELFPKSNLEKIWNIGIMFTGLFMAVVFVGQFIEIIENSKQSLSGAVDATDLEI